MKVYTVETKTRVVLAIFANYEDAAAHADVTKFVQGKDCKVVERTLFYGQAQRPGYSK